MGLITIDRDKCRRDKICMAECPFSLIKEGPEGYPEVRKAAEKLCIHCGHCLAVCPHSALTLQTTSPEECVPVDRKKAPGPEQLEYFLKARRSIRNYKDKPVPREILARLLDLTRWAPSARNIQPVRWLMVETPAETRRLAGLVVDWFKEINHFPGVISAWEQGRDMVLREAPHVVLAYAKSEGLKPVEDCTIALTYLDLAAHSLGLGTCWAGFLMSAATTYAPLMETLALPAGHQVYGAMMLGYPRFRYQRIPPRGDAQITWW